MGMSSRSQSSPGIDVQQVETLAANSGLEQSLSAPTADSLPPCRNLFQQVDLKPSQATSQNRSPSPDRFPPGLQEWRSYMVQTGDSLPSLADPSQPAFVSPSWDNLPEVVGDDHEEGSQRSKLSLGQTTGLGHVSLASLSTLQAQ